MPARAATRPAVKSVLARESFLSCAISFAGGCLVVHAALIELKFFKKETDRWVNQAVGSVVGEWLLPLNDDTNLKVFVLNAITTPRVGVDGVRINPGLDEGIQRLLLAVPENDLPRRRKLRNLDGGELEIFFPRVGFRFKFAS